MHISNSVPESVLPTRLDSRHDRGCGLSEVCCVPKNLSEITVVSIVHLEFVALNQGSSSLYVGDEGAPRDFDSILISGWSTSRCLLWS